MFTFHNDLLHKRIRSCVAYGALLGIIDYALFLADFAVSGRMLGEQALSGITVVNPLITFLTFINIIIPSGTLAAIAYAEGRGDTYDANRLFGQGLIICIVLGVAFSAIVYILGSSYYGHMHISGEVSDYASQYCLGLVFAPLFMFLNTFLYFIHIGEGFEGVCVASSIAKLIVTVILNIILCDIWGTLGIGIATTVGYLASLIVKSIPMFSRKFSLKFRVYVDIRRLMRLTLEGLILCADYICPFIFAIVMNKVVIYEMGEMGTVVFSIILNIETMCMSLYSCLANCVQSSIYRYKAEDNNVNIYRAIKFMLVFFIQLSVVLTVIIQLLSPFIPEFFGVREEATISASVLSIRLYTPFIIFLGIGTMLSRYYVYMGKRLYGFVFILYTTTVVPIIMQFILGEIYGSAGIWIGLGSGYLISMILNLIIIGVIRRRMDGNYNRFFIDVNALRRQLSYNLKATENDIRDCLKKIKTDIKDERLDSVRWGRIVFMAEENMMNILDHAHDTTYNIEISIIRPDDINKDISLIIRSDCILTDFVEDTTCEQSFRENIISRFMTSSLDSYFLSRKTETTIMYKC